MKWTAYSDDYCSFAVVKEWKDADMNIRELLEREKYINDTVNKFAERTCNMEAHIGWDNPSIIISVNDARQIATCLDWLQAIFKQNIDSISVYDMSIKNIPDYL